jgi:hypothetical protein
MSIRKIPTCEEAKQQIKLVDYLAALGYRPEKVSGNDFWYLSPLHDEKTASFKVNNKINAWKDWGSGEKGTLIDFGVKYHKCTVSDFLQKLSAFNFIPNLEQLGKTKDKTLTEDDKKIVITKVQSLCSFSLLHYLQRRKIPDSISRQFCKEVNYTMNGKNYYAIGFKNDAGGYELRNRYSKGSSAPKTSTFIDNKGRSLAVFEGFFDFLSYKTIQEGQCDDARNYLILNSTSFFEQQLSKMQEHEKVHCYLDNDKTGDKCIELALQTDSGKFIDERGLFKGYNDLNDWHQHIGLHQQMRMTPKP